MRAGIVRDAWEYPWSGAANHAGKTDQDRIVESDDMLRELIGEWKSYLRDDDREDFLNSVRRDPFVNRPLGDAAFVSDLEKRFQSRLALSSKVVTPVKTGVQCFCNPLKSLDSGFHRNDDSWAFLTFDEFVKTGEG